ncbi:HK97 family phage prohead protease [Pelagibacterium halotolerans]|uniref:HK97 family phage prohead protease n=1 Tax=Pelagibacterium halotolerans TaxID=531813 RepID=UPI00384B7152
MSVAIDADGRFSGYASIFSVPDQGGDVVMPGAFSASLKARTPARVRLLFQHDPKEPIGLWDEIAEDARGLRVSGRLLDGVPRAQSLRALIAKGAIDGLSIGFRAVRASRDGRTGTRRLWAVDLWEISIVTFPMMDQARIASVPSGAETAQLAATLGAAAQLFRA